MSCFDVKILDPDINTITIESCVGDQPASIEVITYDNTNILEISHCLSIADIKVKDILAGSGINIVTSSGIYTVSLSDTYLTSSDIADFLESVQDIIGQSGLSAGNYVNLNYNDSTGLTTISVTGLQPSGNYSVVGHTHTSNQITDFNNAVSGLIPPSNFTSLSGISGVTVSNSGTNYIVSLTDPTIQLEDITNLSINARNFLLTPSSSNLRTLVTDETGLGNVVFSNSPILTGAPSVPTAPAGTNTSQIANTSFVRTEIINLIDTAPGALDTLNELAAALGDDANFATTITNSLANKAALSGAVFTGSVTIPSGTGNFNSLTVNGTGVSLQGHTHTSSNITDFNSSVSGLLPSVSGSGYVNTSFNNNIYTISVSGLQPSGSYASGVHSHGNITSSGTIGSTSGLLVITENSGILTTTSGISSSYITNFNSSVSGLLPTINNSGDNRLLTSNGTATGIDAESDLLFDNGGGVSHVQFRGYFGGLISFDDALNNTIGYSFGQTQITSESGIELYLSNTSRMLIDSSGLYYNNIPVSISGHIHTSSDITNFNSSVSGLLPVKDIVGGSGINVSSLSGTYTVAVTGIAGLISEEVDDRVSNLLVAGSYTNLNYNDNSNSLTISVTGLQPSGNYSLVGHTHLSTDISDSTSFGRNILTAPSYEDQNYLGWTIVDTSTSNVTAKVGGKYYFPRILFVGPPAPFTCTVNDPASGSAGQFYHIIRPSGGYNSIIVGGTTYGTGSGVFIERYWSADATFPASGSWKTRTLSDYHNHTSNQITNFNTSVSGLLPNVTGSGYITSNFANNTYTIGVTGLQPSGNYSVVGHTHLSSDITDFNNSVSGLIPVKNILSGTGISISNTSGIYTIESTGSGVLSDQAKSLVTTVFNKTGSPIPKMTAVYIDGGQGDLPTISLAIATSDMTSAGTYGLTYETIANMQSGKVIVFGTLTGLDTDQFNPTAPHGNVNGSVIYLSPSVSGSLTLTKPSAPNHIVAIGTIVRTHQNEGVIEVRVQNGFELDELHNVAISGVSNGQFLQYNSGNQLWVPTSSGNFNTLSVNGTGVSLQGHTHTSSNITDFNSSVSGLLPSVTGSGYATSNFANNIYTISVTGSGLVQTNTTGITGSSVINNMVQISQSNYDALITKDPNTVYFIV